MAGQTECRIIRTDWNRKHRHRPIYGATLELRRDGDDRKVASWSTGGGAYTVQLDAGQRYRLTEARHKRWHRARRATVFTAAKDPTDLPRRLRPRWGTHEADLVVADSHIPLAAMLFAFAGVIAAVVLGLRGGGEAATRFAQQIGIDAPDTRPHVRIAGATTYMSIEDTTWTAEAGEQPIVIRNPPTSQSTGKVFDIPLDAETFALPYEDLPTGKRAKAHISLYWEDDEGSQMGPVTRDGKAVEYDWEFVPRDQRGETSVDLDLTGCRVPKGAVFAMAEVRLYENQSVDISPRIYLDYDGDAKGLNGRELIDALQADYETECVFDPVDRDANGNVTSYNFLIQPGHQVTSVRLDRAPRVGSWDLYVYYTALDTVDHHLCSPGLIGGTKVTVTER